MTDQPENRGKRMYEWIAEQHAAGRTVYVHTYTRVTKIAPKHADRVRLAGTHCQMTSGRNWVSLNFSALSAS